MRKLVALFVAVLAVTGALTWFLFQEESSTSTGGDAAAREEGAATETPDAAEEGIAAAAKAARDRARAEPEKDALAIAGTVLSSAGEPVAGASVEAFAVPAGEDLSDEDRVALVFLTKAFGKERGARMLERTRGLRGLDDPAKMMEALPSLMTEGMELMTDEGGFDAIASMMSLARDLPAMDDAPWRSVGAARTAADGTFRVAGLAPGRVELRVKAEAHARTKTRVAAGDLAVAIRLAPGVRVEGVVTCRKEPVVGASVAAKGASAETGAGGRFALDAVPLDANIVIAAAEGCVSAGVTLSLSPGKTAAELVIDLEPAGGAAGHVASAEGGPIAGARVVPLAGGNPFMSMMGAAGGGGRVDLPPDPAVTGPDGAFSLTGLRAGETKLRVDAEGFVGTGVTIQVRPGVVAPAEILLVREAPFTGTVRSAAGGPIDGARVRVEVAARDAASGMIGSMMGGTFRSATTAADGSFRVTGLAEGERRVRVEAPKHLPTEERVVFGRAPTVRDFVLQEGYRIGGTVADAAGTPLAGAKVSVSGKPAAGGAAQIAAMFGAGRAAAEVTTGADGAWTADGLPEGPFTVRAGAEGYLDAEEAGVAPGRTDVRLTLRLGATIRGRVVSAADGAPLAGADVRRDAQTPGAAAGMRRPRGRGGFPFTLPTAPAAKTDEQGRFEIRGVEPGAHALTASLRGYADPAAIEVSCTEGGVIDDVEIRLEPGVAVSGSVVDGASGAPVAGAVVWVASGANPFAAFATSDLTGGAPKAPADSIQATTGADGGFVLQGLTPGRATLEVRATGLAPLSAGDVTAPATDLVLRLSRGGAVEGRVTASDGSPVAGAQVMAMRNMMGMGGMRQARTDADGNYRFEQLAPGAVQLMLLDPKNPMIPSGMASVVVKEGETVRHDFTKKAGGQQIGGNVAKDGKALVNAPIILMGGSAGVRMATTDDSGRFAFDGLEPGDYTVMVQTSFLGGGSTSRRVTVGASGRVDDVRLELSSAKVEGDVVDAETGEGIANAQVALTESGARVASGEDFLGTYRGQALADERGHFVISDVQQGAFTLKATAAGYPSVTLEGVASGSRGVRVTMRRGVEFLVTVLGPSGTVQGAMVQSVDASGNTSMLFDMTMSGISGADGVARLRLAPGRYTLRVSAGGLLPADAEVETSAGSATIRLDAGATLEVVATGADGAPLAGARVKLVDAAGVEIKRGLSIDSFVGASDRTGTDGRLVRQGLAPGDVTVLVTDASGREARATTTLEANRTRRVDVAVK